MKLIPTILVLALAATFSAQAMKIRPPSNPTPPPGPVEPIPEPPVTPNPPDPGTLLSWKSDLIWSRPLQWKIKFIQQAGDAELMSTFDRKTRRNSELHVRYNGKVLPAVWRGGEETIGEWTPLADAVRGVTYMAAEVGETVLKYDHVSRKVSRGVRIPAGYKWNVETALWAGDVVIGGSGPGRKAIVFSATSGKTLWTAPFSGLIAGMAEGPDGALWMAVSDTDWGLYSTKGESLRTIKPASVAWWRDRLTFGGMDDGKLWQMVAGKPVLLHDFKCSKLNVIRVDPRRNVLLVAGSKPDTFAAVHPDGRIETIARFTDEAQEKSGQQFDSYIAPGSGAAILYGRETPRGCEFYRATPANQPAPPAPAPTPPVVEPGTPDYAGLVWLAEKDRHAKGGTPAPGTLRAWVGLFDGQKPGIFFETAGARDGDWWASVTILRDGVYYTGPYDGLGKNPNGRKFKSFQNLYGGDKGGPLIARHGPKRTEPESRAHLRLRPGEVFWVNVFDASSRSYYPLIRLVYPERDR